MYISTAFNTGKHLGFLLTKTIQNDQQEQRFLYNLYGYNIKS